MQNCKGQIYALGVGHNTPVFIDLAEACGFEVVGLYHFQEGRTGEYCCGIQIIGSFTDLFSKSDLRGLNFMLTMGANKIRAELADRILQKGGSLPSLIHPMAVISRFAEISPIGVCISPFTYVQADSIVGRNTILLSHVNISHTTTIGENCFIAGGSTIGAYTKMENFVFIGQGVLSVSGKVKKIGESAFVGAGSLLIRDVEAETIVYGRPANVSEKSKNV